MLCNITCCCCSLGLSLTLCRLQHCFCARSTYLKENTQSGNNGCHGDKTVKANTSQEEHGAVTMVARKSSVWLTQSHKVILPGGEQSQFWHPVKLQIAVFNRSAHLRSLCGQPQLQLQCLRLSVKIHREIRNTLLGGSATPQVITAVLLPRSHAMPLLPFRRHVVPTSSGSKGNYSWTPLPEERGSKHYWNTASCPRSPES